MIFQFGIIIFAFVVILRTYGQYKKEFVSRYWLLAFSLVWVAICVAAIIPHVTDDIAHVVGIERGADMFVYSAVLVLLYAVYRLFVRTQRMHEEITELVRQIALANPKVPMGAKKSGEMEDKR